MQTFTVTQGDDEEFALSIFDPNSGLFINMTTHTNWTIELQWKGLSSSLSQTFTGVTMLINTSHADPTAVDGSVKITITSAQSQSLAVGTYDLWIRLLDSNTTYSHLFRGDVKLVIVDSPLSS